MLKALSFLAGVIGLLVIAVNLLTPRSSTEGCLAGVLLVAGALLVYAWRRNS